jgi:hypothetical protein
MKLKVIIIFAIISIIFSGCTSNYSNTMGYTSNEDKEVTPSTTSKLKETTKPTIMPTIELTKDITITPTGINSYTLINEYNENCALLLGSSRSQVKSKLKELNIPIIKEYEGTDDNDNPDGVWIIYTKNLELDFNIDNKLNQVFINSILPTSLGLKKGDTLQKMHDLYGKENSYDRGWGMYIYKMKTCNLGIIYNLGDNNNTVDSWTIFLED